MDESRQATTLFLGTSLITAIVVGSMMMSGRTGGSLDNRIEPLFWAGAIFAGVALVLFAAATYPRAASGGGSTVRLVRAGLVLFTLGPILCIVAVFVDYWI